MPARDKRIDQYIANSAPFAQPILTYLRETVHAGCADVQETMKWSFPHFEYEGEILCSMAAFKRHCAFGFWKAAVMSDPNKLLQTIGRTAMGSFGRITDLKDLPSDRVLIRYIKEAARLNKNKVKAPQAKKNIVSKTLEIPEYFLKALKKNKAAHEGFKGFSPSHKKEYVEWITGAKTEETRIRRINTAMDWIAEGKSLNHKYTRPTRTDIR